MGVKNMTSTKTNDAQAVTIAFTGDLSFTKYFSKANEKNQIISQAVTDFLKASDYCVGNIEGPIMAAKSEEKKEFAHYTDESYAKLISEWNINIWNVANNHMLDFGDDGIKQTLENAKNNECDVIGGGESIEEAAEPLMLAGGGGIGIFALTYSPAKPKNGGTCRCLNLGETDLIRQTISSIKKTCRWCIIVIHGGDEFSGMPMPYTRDKYMSFLEMGADIIVGHHPHVVQNYERVGDKMIFYSLGNFVFDTDYQRAQHNTDRGMLIRLNISEDMFEWEQFPIKIDREEQMICKADAPEIFTDIQASEYKVLWPQAARGLIYSERKIKAYLNPKKYGKYNALLWNLRELYMCRKKRERLLLNGKIRSYLKPVGKDRKSLAEYLKKR